MVSNLTNYFFPTKDDGLSHPKLEAVAKMYNMDNVSNVEVEFKWIRLGLAAKWEKAVKPALRLATVQVAHLGFASGFLRFPSFSRFILIYHVIYKCLPDFFKISLFSTNFLFFHRILPIFELKLRDVCKTYA